ncbi:MAG: T9SS type A sorting domain-containing protein [Bacteroidetes bacterium]|nr:T9SS type A sorting domain-containing protein [Bacteroidota bacterium]
MKKLILLAAGFIAFHAEAQIPNGGFESWTTTGSYMDPQGYLTPNAYATSFYPVTRSIDHYPTYMGSYSVRLENNIALSPNVNGLGLILQNRSNNIMNGPGASFPVSGHPTSITGYYKFAPQNGDTMRVLAMLYKNGSQVATAMFSSTVAVANWTSFSAPFPSYTAADSCAILIAAYNCDGPPPAYVPHGNSVLYVDNLNFDVLLTSVFEQSAEAASFKLHPNPASDLVTLDVAKTYKTNVAFNIYNAFGRLVGSGLIQGNQQQINTADLTNGVYTLEIRSEEGIEQQKFIVQK